MSALLKFIQFKDFNLWDVKRHLSTLIYSSYEIVKLGDYIQEENIKIKPFEYPSDDFKILGVSNKIRLFDNEVKKGKDINQPYKKIKNGFLSYNPYRINVGSIGLKTDKQKNDLISPAYVVFSCNEKLSPEYLFMIFKTNIFNTVINESTRGSVRQILAFDILEILKIPLPSFDIQERIVKDYQNKLDLIATQEQQAKEKEKEIEEYLHIKLDMNYEENPIENILDFINYKTLTSWSYRDLLGSVNVFSNFFDTIKFNQKISLFNNIFRGKSPKYTDNSNSIILNQKCNRWNKIELQYSKSVEDDWISKIDKKFFTQENDIIINSTGDGTIGRATYITNEFENLLYDSHILLLRVNKSEINALYLTYYINSPYGQSQIENIKSAIATKQTELGINNLKNIQFIIPPLEIQNQIAKHIQKLKDEQKILIDKSLKNKILALQEFEKEIFNEV
ncbi:restriction endonuclease subunit S [Arcobacteraceae bacterium]|nr:restriction endonuclease subunit S [Arcobacteraceae bacterium]